MENEQNNKVLEKGKNTTMLQILKTCGILSNFNTKQPGGVISFNLLEYQTRNLLTFQVVAQVITLVEFNQLI